MLLELQRRMAEDPDVNVALVTESDMCIKHVKVPCQTNGDDCNLFAQLFVEHLFDNEAETRRRLWYLFQLKVN